MPLPPGQRLSDLIWGDPYPDLRRQSEQKGPGLTIPARDTQRVGNSGRFSGQRAPQARRQAAHFVRLGPCWSCADRARTPDSLCQSSSQAHPSRRQNTRRRRVGGGGHAVSMATARRAAPRRRLRLRGWSRGVSRSQPRLQGFEALPHAEVASPTHIIPPPSSHHQVLLPNRSKITHPDSHVTRARMLPTHSRGTHAHARSQVTSMLLTPTAILNTSAVGARLGAVCSLMYPRCLEQCLVHRGCSGDIC